ncbi:10142_t:CDS:10, partial [Cetraspora pellucida]
MKRGRGKQRITEHNKDESVKKTGFRSIPLIPTPEELLVDQLVELPSNKIEGSYESIDEYLETHYSLMREDFIRPLREGIRLGVTFSSTGGVIHRISFRTQHSERIRWSFSKRLIPGTLVVLSNDNFNTMKFAIVVSRPTQFLEKPHDLQIEVSFKPEEAEFDIDEPEYLKRRHSVYDFGKVAPFEKIEENYGTSRIDIKKDWPPLEVLDSTLHTSQYEALKQMLTKRFVLIQGPPGTGKTYVGLTAVQLLIENTSGTILIACQTNHALDQFLENIQKFEPEPKIVRLGSRTQSKSIKGRTLFEIRKDLKLSDQESPYNPQINRLHADRARVLKEMKPLLEEIHNPCVTLEFIQEQGFLTETQIASLKDDNDEWVTSNPIIEDGEKDYIKDWLATSITTHSSLHNDLEYLTLQVINEDKDVVDNDDEVDDEEEISAVAAEFQGIDEGKPTTGDYVVVRSETYVDSSTYVSEEDLKKYMSSEDLQNIPQEGKAAMHNRWRQKRLDFVNNKLHVLNKKYSKICEQIKYERIREDLMILKDARVVGMTTTAAVKAKILIVEEAAETVESHIITALTPSIEHLILIGDHKQLRPNISVHELAEKHYLDVSLFERLTKTLDYTQLTEQRRMRTEIRKLLEPIYGETLTDHDSVREYPRVPGLFHDLFFFDHQEEESAVKDSTSKINNTILSMYSSQRKEIMKFLREESRRVEVIDQVKDIKVSSVDGFQGNENDIIILSLVRSRDPRCELWKDILKIFGKKDACGQSLIIFCQKHSDFEIGDDGLPKNLVTTPVRWAGDIPSSGGCIRKCEEIMKCGHDSCLRQFPCGHTCTKKCREPCGQCDKIITIRPPCGHAREISCHKLRGSDKYRCTETCSKKLKCGHQCKEMCSSPCATKCMVQVPIKFPGCGHIDRIYCYRS